MKRFFLPIFIFGTITLIVILINSFVPYKIIKKPLSPPSSEVSSTLNPSLFPNYFVLRNYNPDAVAGTHNTPEAWLSIISEVNDEDLLGIRCSPNLVNEIGSFFIREYDTHRPVQQITDPELVKTLEQLKETTTQPRKVLRARICQTDTGKMLLEYTDGLQPYVHPDEGRQTRNFLTYLEDPSTFIPGIQILSQNIWPYPGCLAPFLLTKDKKLYYGCKITNETGYTTTYYLVDFSSLTVKSLLTCTFVYSPEPARKCMNI